MERWPGIMKWNFSLFIKSHCSIPDFEDECEAPSFIDAAQLFKEVNKNALKEYSWQDLMPFIELAK